MLLRESLRVVRQVGRKIKMKRVQGAADMKRFGVNLVSLGLALTAGSALAGENNWPVQGQHPSGAVQGSSPALLPPAVRGVHPAQSPDAVWLPAQSAPSAPLVQAGGVSEPEYLPPAQSAGPRIYASSDLGSLPPVPIPADTPHTPPRPVYPPPIPAPGPVRSARPADSFTSQPMVMPKSSDSPLPTPRPVESQPQPQRELPCAPPELMYPVGARPKPVGTFGSAPIRLSRDFPPLGDLFDGHSRGDVVVLDSETGNGPVNRFFVRGEYLQWWLPGYRIPVLATTNSTPGSSGFFGEPGVTAIVGPGPFIDSTRSGFRVRAGAWIDDCASCGIDAGAFFLPNRTNSVTVNSNRFPLITRPVFVPNLIPGTNQPFGENGESVAVPGLLVGALTVRGDSQLWGADVNLRKCLCRDCDTRAEYFVGYRHLNLRETLTITENIVVAGTGGTRLMIPDPIGTVVSVQDSFATRNYFHGGQLGVAYERQFGRWNLDTRASVALGATHQVLEINGAQQRQRPGMPVMNFRGGLLAAGPNLGRFTNDEFSVVPEFTFNLGYWVTPNIRVFACYNFLFWSIVIRPGDQIDRVVDLTFVPNAPPVAFSGQNRPRPLFKQTDLVVNGVQFGLELRW